MRTVFWRLLAGQLVGRAIVLAAAWYWLGLGVSTPALVAANVLLAILMVAGWSWLDAWGLGQSRRWYWALPIVLAFGLSFWHPVAAMAGVVVGLGLLLPSAAAARWIVCRGTSYWGRGVVYLLVLLLVPIGLLRWIPPLEGLAQEGLSFGLRAGLAYLSGIGAWTLLLRQAGDITEAERS